MQPLLLTKCTIVYVVTVSQMEALYDTLLQAVKSGEINLTFDGESIRVDLFSRETENETIAAFLVLSILINRFYFT